MIDERHEELASLYALNLLEPAERVEFEALLQRDAELAQFVRALEDDAAALAYSVPPIEPPAHLKAAILAKIAPVEGATKIVKFPLSRVIVPWALAAGFALVAGTLTLERTNLQKQIDKLNGGVASTATEQTNLQTALARLEGENKTLATAKSTFASQLAKLEDDNRALAVERTTLQNTVATLQNDNAFSQLKIATLGALVDTYSKGKVVVLWDEQKQTGVIKVANMPMPASDRDYQLWVVDPDYQTPVSAGVFRLGQDGIGRTVFHPVKPIHKATTFAISIEQKGGVPVHKGPIIMAGQ